MTTLTFYFHHDGVEYFLDSTLSSPGVPNFRGTLPLLALSLSNYLKSRLNPPCTITFEKES